MSAFRTGIDNDILQPWLLKQSGNLLVHMIEWSMKYDLISDNAVHHTRFNVLMHGFNTGPEMVDIHVDDERTQNCLPSLRLFQSSPPLAALELTLILI